MTQVLLTAATVVAGAAVVVATLVLLTTRRMSVALPIALELLLAAGLLRLAVAETWTAILTAAVIVAIRQFVVASFRANASTRASS
jgi:Protein of unknown function (DUF1622)